MTARCIFPSFIRSAVSNAKEEKVVKPPHIPTFRNNTVLESTESVFIANATTIPIRKEPAIFIINVFMGNVQDEKQFTGKRLELLQKAADEVQFLLDRGYDVKPVTTFVGNHYLFSLLSLSDISLTCEYSQYPKRNTEYGIESRQMYLSIFHQVCRLPYLKLRKGC